MVIFYKGEIGHFSGTTWQVCECFYSGCVNGLDG